MLSKFLLLAGIVHSQKNKIMSFLSVRGNKYLPIKVLEGTLLPGTIFVIWLICSRLNILSKDFFPSPGDVVNGFHEVLNDGSFLDNLGMSVIRVLKGFLLGSTVGFVIGITLGMSRFLEKLITPIFNAIRQVPLPAWAPLLVLVSLGEMSRVLFIAIGACYPVVLNTFEGVKNVRNDYVEVGKVFKFNRVQRFFKIILPSSFPSTLTGLRLSLSISWMLVVAAEIFMTSGGGIGEMMWACREYSRMDLVVVCIIAIALVGFTMNFFMQKMEMFFSFWRLTLKQSR
ncbi:MAG: ABC transporter permease [Chlorobium sp.]|nr:MAG: ABC transporter permease [Chlorobium sp.]